MTGPDRTDATEQEFRARIAPFEGAVTPPEVREAAVLEEVAQAIAHHVSPVIGRYRYADSQGQEFDRDELKQAYREAAVAAYRATGGAEEADAAVECIAEKYRDPTLARFAINDFRDWLADR